jgi:hypothetical protein
MKQIKNLFLNKYIFKFIDAYQLLKELIIKEIKIKINFIFIFISNPYNNRI